MSILVFLEHHGNELQKGSLGVLSKAATLGAGDVAAVLVGGGVQARSPREAGKFGAAKVHVARGRLARAAAAAAARRRDREGRRRTAATTPCSSRTRCSRPTSPPASSARLDAGLNWDLVDIESHDGRSSASGRRCRTRCSSTSAGARRRDSRSSAPARSMPPPTSGGEPQVEDVSVEFEPHSRRPRRSSSQEQEQSSGPSIEDADVIVAGGRGLGAPENFTLAEELARALGGAVGATRAVVDAGLVPVRRADRADRQGRLAEALRRARHLRRDPAQGRACRART